MLVGLLADLAVGALCVVMGALLWKKQKVSLLHDYHYKNVKPEDIPAYARKMGIGLILIGAGICLFGLTVFLFHRDWGWVFFSAGFASGITVIVRAQKKYNGSLLG